MSDNKSVSVNVPFPFLGILTLIFITLKLTGTITWSWWWVLAPMWMPLAIFLGIALIILIGVAAGGRLIVKKNNKEKLQKFNNKVKNDIL